MKSLWDIKSGGYPWQIGQTSCALVAVRIDIGINCQKRERCTHVGCLVTNYYKMNNEQSLAYKNRITVNDHK